MAGLEPTDGSSNQLFLPFNRLYGSSDLSNPSALLKTNTETMGLISDTFEMSNVASAFGPNGESGFGVRFLGSNDSFILIDDPDNRVSPNIKPADNKQWSFHMRPWQGCRGTLFSMMASNVDNQPVGIFTISYDGNSTLLVQWRQSVNESEPANCSFTGCIKPNVWQTICKWYLPTVNFKFKNNNFNFSH